MAELANISKGAQMNVGLISDTSFIFLEAKVNNKLYCIQGILNAFIIRFKYSMSRKNL
jgi:hypothetical protein